MAINIEAYWMEPPPSPSPGLTKWLARVEKGFVPNARLRGMGYYDKATYYKIYIWEWLNVLSPAFDRADAEQAKR